MTSHLGYKLQAVGLQIQLLVYLLEDTVLYYTSVTVLSLFHQQAMLIIKKYLHTVIESGTQKLFTSIFDKPYQQLLHFDRKGDFFFPFSLYILQSSFQVGIILHYSTLATVLWVGVTARNIYKQVTKKAKRCQDPDELPPPPRPMLRYLISLLCYVKCLLNINFTVYEAQLQQKIAE